MIQQQSPLVSLSVVSHGQADLVAELVASIQHYCTIQVELILTLNIAEQLPFDVSAYMFPIYVIRNTSPKGFGANHNAASKSANGIYFCVLNPDIRLTSDPFPELLECISAESVGVVAPLVTNVAGENEDNARQFPTPLKIMAKALIRKREPDYKTLIGDYSPDWVGGMFMLIPVDVYRKLNGFDERYFLYYEDVDLCARMRLSGYDIRLCTKVKVIHDARRQSHRDFRYLRWHFTSMMRFFFSKPFIQIMSRRLMQNKPSHSA
jgi:N-acetylglucosaminyl-diphospho-decaprenol L-rhamnosyltransferase